MPINDISPRVGAAYDVFGNGKTAIKFNFGRYLAPATNDSRYTLNNPANRDRHDVASRNWADTNGNYVVDCDILNPAAQAVPGGDTCGALTGNCAELRQDRQQPRARQPGGSAWLGRPAERLAVGHQRAAGADPARLAGGRLQPPLVRQPLPRALRGPSPTTSSSARRTTSKWTITAPLDSRLPDGGGYPITIYTITPAASARGGAELRHARNRLRPGPHRLLARRRPHGERAAPQRAQPAGRHRARARPMTDNCATTVLIDSPDPRNCRNEEPFQTTLRGSVAYTIPKVDVLIAATMRSQSGIASAPRLQVDNGASWLVPNTVVQQLLGRLPPGALATGTTTVPLLDTDHRLYGPRRNQIDMRFAKIVRFRSTRTEHRRRSRQPAEQQLGDGVRRRHTLTTQPNGGAWLDPTTILQPRFARFSVTFNF